MMRAVDLTIKETMLKNLELLASILPEFGS